MKRNIKTIFFLFSALTLLSSCTRVKTDTITPETAALNVDYSSITPEQSSEIVNEIGSSWLYGHGFGSTIANIGGSIVFPPYALYIAGNAALSLGGFEPVHVTELLPENAESSWSEFYDSVTSVPGRVSSAIAGREFRNRELITKRYKKILQPS